MKYIQKMSGYYASCAEENRLNMIHSYFALHHTESYFGREEGIRRGLIKINPDEATWARVQVIKFRDEKSKILQEINYEDANSVNDGLKKIETLAITTDEEYSNKGYDPERTEICKDMWNEYDKLNDVMKKLQ